MAKGVPGTIPQAGVQAALDSGEYKDQAAAAWALGVTRARVTQLLDLTLLAPDIQEEVLFLEAMDGQEPVNERSLQEIVRHSAWSEQRGMWQRLRPSAPGEHIA